MSMESIFGDPKKKRIYKYIFFIAVIASVVIDFFIPRPHPHFAFDKIPGFHAALGLVGAFIVIVFAKLIYGKFVYRKENYYDE